MVVAVGCVMFGVVCQAQNVLLVVIVVVVIVVLGLRLVAGDGSNGWPELAQQRLLVP